MKPNASPHPSPKPPFKARQARDRLLMTSATFLLAPVSLVPREGCDPRRLPVRGIAACWPTREARPST